MDYVVALRVGLNDVKALVNLEETRKTRVLPLLSMRGANERQLDSFLNNWGDSPFLLDISRYPTDAQDVYVAQNNLHSPTRAFQAKQQFFAEQRVKNASLIPVVGWKENDPVRDAVRLALDLCGAYPKVAIRLEWLGRALPPAWTTAQNILNAVPDPEQIIFVFDFQRINSIPDISPGGPIETAVRSVQASGVSEIVLTSTSFPEDKPASGASRTATCLDIPWQTTFRLANPDLRLIYGDYAATNPTGVLEFAPWMPIIPFANYFRPNEWWQGRMGADKEFNRYVELAAQIRALPLYHGDDFCWATREIARIATTGQSYGNNGVWNGYRINQHICAVIDYMDAGGFDPLVDDEDAA